MKSWYKSKINWVGIALILVGLLEFITPGVLESLGITNAERWASILGFLLVFLRQIMNTNTTPILKIGGRPTRTKKPTAIINETTFAFSGIDIFKDDQASYTHTSYPDLENPIDILAVEYSQDAGLEHTIVTFAEPILGETHELIFYFE